MPETHASRPTEPQPGDLPPRRGFAWCERIEVRTEGGTKVAYFVGELVPTAAQDNEEGRESAWAR